MGQPLKLEWSATALADLDRFAAFLHDRHPRLAKVIGAEIKRKAEILSEYPLVGRVIEGRPEYRQLVLEVAGAKYIFQYAFDGERLVMLRVFP
ncbi:MAG TPA: type II toxin-antitoxin system RelE/ParE family toxin [Xanthobacteraceae bacterium]|nr:type II toxin-antitoxin system RelE/ParE family toxin [Xanthobacteraceae bacterium]